MDNLTYSDLNTGAEAIGDGMYSTLSAGTEQGAADATYSQLSAMTVNTSNNSKYENRSLNTKPQSTKSNCKEGDKKKLRIAIALIVVLLIYLVLSTIAIIAAFIKISQLSKDIEDASLIEPSSSESDEVVMLDSVADRVVKVENATAQLNNSLSLLQNESQQIRNDIEMLTGNSPCFPASSCAALPSCSPSGYYWVRATNGSVVRVFCDMTLSCGNITGGWMRVAELDMTNTCQKCPKGLKLHVEESGLRTCGIESDSADCPSIIYSASSFQYSRVCGSIRAYQYHSTDAFVRHGVRPDLSTITIDDNYVDGVILTHGNETRQHIWTFAAGVYHQHGSIPTCPCGGARSSPDAGPPNFVNNEYFCDASSSHTWGYDTSNPMWDGQGCVGMCCTFNSPPWFYKQLSESTTDDIEMRVCSDQERDPNPGSGDEDIRIEKIHVFVQ